MVITCQTRVVCFPPAGNRRLIKAIIQNIINNVNTNIDILYNDIEFNDKR